MSSGDRFGKEQIVNSSLFTAKEKDVLNVILQNDKSYTIEEAKQSMGLFKNKEVMN
jgi:dsDNA-binding SOS-regulon protein